jgi:hypothetical protein
MGWREEIAKTLTRAAPAAPPAARRTDLPTQAYHGTNVVFPGFENQAPIPNFLDRALGTHVAKDPALASTFANRWIKKPNPRLDWYLDTKVEGSPHVLPLRIPAEDKFLQAVQPPIPRDVEVPGLPEWRRVMMDENAITRMVAGEAYRQNPDMLARYLQQARALPRQEAVPLARDLAAGETRTLEGKPYDLNRFISNYMGTPYNQVDREAMVNLARQQWENQGYKGIRYINTSPSEAGARGVKDPTSYIVFNPANIRSEFARMDPAKAGSADLMSGVAGAVAFPAIGRLAAQDAYEEAPDAAR